MASGFPLKPTNLTSMKHSSRFLLKIMLCLHATTLLASGYQQGIFSSESTQTITIPLESETRQILCGIRGSQTEIRILHKTLDGSIQTQVNLEGNLYTITLPEPDEGTYLLELSAQTSTESDAYWWLQESSTPDPAAPLKLGRHGLETVQTQIDAISRIDLAQNLIQKGQLQTAFVLFRQTIDDLKESEERILFRARLQKHLPRLPSIQLPVLQAELLLKFGNLSSFMGYYEEAARHLNKAATIFEDAGLHLAQAQAMHDKAFVHTITGDYDLAETNFSTALQLQKGTKTKKLQTQMELAWLTKHKKKYNQAIEAFKALIPKIDRSDDTYLQLEIYDRLGSTFVETGDFEEAEKAYEKSFQRIAAHTRKDQPYLYYVNALNRGYLYTEMDKGQKAIDSTQKALDLYEPDWGREGQHAVYFIRGTAFQLLGENKKATTAFEKSLSEAEIIRQRSKGREGLNFFQFAFDNMQSLFKHLATLHEKEPEKGHHKRAFWNLERVKASQLSVHKSTKNPDEPSLDHIRRLDSDIPIGQNKSTISTLENPNILLEQVHSHILGPKEGLLAYFQGEKVGYWFLVRRDGLDISPLPNQETLKRHIDAFIHNIENPGPSAEQHRFLAEQLSQMMLPKTQQLQALEHLYILPQGEIYRIPFEALVHRQSKDHPSVPLIKNHSLSILPSVAFGLQLKKTKNNGNAHKTLVISDPIFNRADSRLHETQNSTNPDPLFPRLIHSRQELSILKELYSKNPPITLSGEQATLAAFLHQPLDQFRLIHLSTHAICIPEHLHSSGLLFSQYDREGQSIDNVYLNTGTIAKQSFKADLVVLSACRGADGPRFQGEGLMGLARAFLQAGAGSVIASRWDVDDQATAVLMQHFYTGLKQGLNSAQALQSAQNLMRKEKRWSQPRYWAGFCLIGDPRKLF